MPDTDGMSDAEGLGVGESSQGMDADAVGSSIGDVDGGGDGVSTKGQGHPGGRGPVSGATPTSGESAVVGYEAYDAYRSSFSTTQGRTTGGRTDHLDGPMAFESTGTTRGPGRGTGRGGDPRSFGFDAQEASDAAVVGAIEAVRDKMEEKESYTNIFGFKSQKDKHSQKEKEDMVKGLRNMYGKQLDEMDARHSKAMNAQKDSQKGKGLLGNFSMTTQDKAMMAISPMGAIMGMVAKGLLSAANIPEYHETDAQSLLNELETSVGLRDPDTGGGESEQLKLLKRMQEEEDDAKKPLNSPIM